jgi:hypothetical protein
MKTRKHLTRAENGRAVQVAFALTRLDEKGDGDLVVEAPWIYPPPEHIPCAVLAEFQTRQPAITQSQRLRLSLSHEGGGRGFRDDFDIDPELSQLCFETSDVPYIGHVLDLDDTVGKFADCVSPVIGSGDNAGEYSGNRCDHEDTSHRKSAPGAATLWQASNHALV